MYEHTSNLRVIQIVPSVYEEQSGPSYVVINLDRNLRHLGFSSSLAAIQWASSEESTETKLLFPFDSGPRKLGRSCRMRDWILENARSGQQTVLHNHGMWQFNALYAAEANRINGIPLVSSTHGALAPWALRHGSRFAKFIFWQLFQHRALYRSACFHATSEQEFKDIRKLGFTNPVAVIPSGIDIPEIKSVKKDGLRKLVFLGRLHPVKGLENLISAWRFLESRFTDWELLIVGDDASYHGPTGYGEHLKKLNMLSNNQRVEFRGAVYGDEKYEILASADLFVLPSFSENFGVSVAEALSVGTPAITTNATPWGLLESYQAGWCIETGEKSLTNCLGNALSQPRTELMRMGQNGREWMQSTYSWDTIASQMVEVYRWVLRLGDKPSFVRAEK